MCGGAATAVAVAARDVDEEDEEDEEVDSEITDCRTAGAARTVAAGAAVELDEASPLESGLLREQLW